MFVCCVTLDAATSVGLLSTFIQYTHYKVNLCKEKLPDMFYKVSDLFYGLQTFCKSHMLNKVQNKSGKRVKLMSPVNQTITSVIS